MICAGTFRNSTIKKSFSWVLRSRRRRMNSTCSTLTSSCAFSATEPSTPLASGSKRISPSARPNPRDSDLDFCNCSFFSLFAFSKSINVSRGTSLAKFATLRPRLGHPAESSYGVTLPSHRGGWRRSRVLCSTSLSTTTRPMTAQALSHCH